MENVHTEFNNIQILDYHISQGEVFSYYQPLLLKGKRVYNDRRSLRACSINYIKQTAMDSARFCWQLHYK